MHTSYTCAPARCTAALFGAAAVALCATGAIAQDCDADLNLDTNVDSQDLNIVLSAFGGSTDGDINSDGTTDSLDLNILLAAFGETGCPGDCCASNGTPGCVDEGCVNLVCAIDGFCCDAHWDNICVGEAAELCGACGGCCEPNGTPGCGDETCQSIVCTTDPFCCDTEWDEICAAEAAGFCGLCGGASGACCFGDAGCQPMQSEADCTAVGGSFQGFGSLCQNVTCPGACCQPNATPGCEVASCEDIVCTLDPFCCATEWDETCTELAAVGCGECGGCCEANGSPGCNDEECESLVCATDPFCCDTEWDSICADEAADICGTCGGCCQPKSTPGCGDADCQEAVCAADPFCCNNSWDDICADEAADLCDICEAPAGPPPPPPPGSGACCFPLTGNCFIGTAFECQTVGGIYSGDGIPCETSVCSDL